MKQILLRWIAEPMTQRHALLKRPRLAVAALLAHFLYLASFTPLAAGVLHVPNASFESPRVPPVSPYAGPDIASWQKSPQPVWYDPAQNADTPWEFLVGSFYNVPFPGTMIENCDGEQASFLFALPEAALFQDYDSVSGTNSAPDHAFNAPYQVGRAYRLTVAVLGGGGGMKPGVTLDLRLYYRNAANERVTVAATSVTNSLDLFPTNTYFVDFAVKVPAVKATDAWAGRPIGIELASTVGFELAGGYWDLDHVRLEELIEVPNASFELPVVPPVTPYAGPEIEAWQKTAQPAWYDPSQNADTPWEFLAGTFFNVPFPGSFIENCDGAQAAFLFALPEAGLFQDYDSLSGTNTTPSRAFNVRFTPGKSYQLTAAVLGGNGGMKPGASLELALYYRDASQQPVTVVSTTVTHSPSLFPTNTQFVDFSVNLPAVRAEDPWANQSIGIRLLSTASFELAGGYWDLDHVRLIETVAPRLDQPILANGQFSFQLWSEPGARFELQSSSSLAPNAEWTTLRTLTNSTGAGVFTEPATEPATRLLRARQL